MANKSRRYRVLADEFKVDSVNRIKPGIAEATRAVLRRVPDHVFVRSIDDPDVALLVGLAREKGIVVTEMGNPRPVSGCNHYQEGTLMKNRLSPRNLGATLYMPATREDIADAVLHGKIPGLRSLVICWRMLSVKQTSPSPSKSGAPAARAQ